MADNGQKSRWDYLGKKPEDTEISGDTSQSEPPERNLLREADHNPDLALAYIKDFLERKPEMDSDVYLKICKFMAFKAKGIQPLRDAGFYRVDVAGPEELREYLKEEHLGWLELALKEISEIEKLDSESESMQVLDPDIDGVACIVERCNPGQAQDILGWTKIWYFGLDRNSQHVSLKSYVSAEKVKQFIHTPFRFPHIVKSVLAYHFSRDDRGREYMSFMLFPDFFSGWASDDNAGDHEMGNVTIYDDGTYEVKENEHQAW
jgi:hypothetical protein